MASPSGRWQTPGAGADVGGVVARASPATPTGPAARAHGWPQERSLADRSASPALAVINGRRLSGRLDQRRVWSMQRSTTSAGAVRPAATPSATLARCAAIQAGYAANRASSFSKRCGVSVRWKRASSPDERLGPVELVERVQLPQAQLVGAAEAPDHRAHEPERDGVLRRELAARQLLDARRPALDQRHERRPPAAEGSSSRSSQVSIALDRGPHGVRSRNSSQARSANWWTGVVLTWCSPSCWAARIQVGGQPALGSTQPGSCSRSTVRASEPWPMTSS